MQTSVVVELQRSFEVRNRVRILAGSGKRQPHRRVRGSELRVRGQRRFQIGDCLLRLFQAQQAVAGNEVQLRGPRICLEQLLRLLERPAIVRGEEKRDRDFLLDARIARREFQGRPPLAKRLEMLSLPPRDVGTQLMELD